MVKGQKKGAPLPVAKVLQQNSRGHYSQRTGRSTPRKKLIEME